MNRRTVWQATLTEPHAARAHFLQRTEIMPQSPQRPFYHSLLVREADPLAKPADRFHTWWYTDRDDLREAWRGTTLRRLAVMNDWRTVDSSLPASPKAFAEALLALGQTLEIQLATTPAATAFKFFRRFLTLPWPPEPREVARAGFERNAGLFLYAARRDMWIRHAFRYDLNQAYNAYLRVWPEPGAGEWQPTNEPDECGIYRVHFLGSDTWLTGQECPELSAEDFSRVTFKRGWRFVHDVGPSAFTEFCDYCATYRGPLRQLVKRFPPLVVGKLRSGWWGPSRRDWYASSVARPLFYAAVVGSLWQRMYRTAMFLGAHLTYAFVDGIHSTGALPDHWIGTEPGTWKLEEETPIRYSGTFGRWRSESTWRQQGIARH